MVMFLAQRSSEMSSATFAAGRADSLLSSVKCGLLLFDSCLTSSLSWELCSSSSDCVFSWFLIRVSMNDPSSLSKPLTKLPYKLSAFRPRLGLYTGTSAQPKTVAAALFITFIASYFGRRRTF